MATTSSPRYVALGLLLLVLLRPAFAESGDAVEALNGSAAADWSYGDGAYVTTQSYGVSAALNVPLWQYFGASAFAASYRTVTKADLSGLALGSSSADSFGDTAVTVGAALFARSPALGRIGVGYQEKLHRGLFAYTAEMQAYLSRWTVTASVERAGIKHVLHGSDNYSIGASFYPADEVRLDARAQILERDVGRIYSVGGEWLPAALRLPISIRLGYSRVTGDVTFLPDNIYGVSVTYFFAPAASLFTLDRAYR